MERVLVTGASGCVGSSLVDRLSDLGHDIVTLSRTPNVRPGSRFSDLSDPTTIVGACRNVDCVVHTASWMPNTQRDRTLASRQPSYVQSVNVDATVALAKDALANDVTCFVYISSTAALGTPKTDIVDEQSSCHPQTLYEISKYQAEQALLDIARGTEMRVVILRPPMICGNGVRGGPLLKLAKMTSRGIFPIFGTSGSATKPLIHVNDLVQAIINAMQIETAQGVFFVHSDGDHPLIDIVTIAARLQGRNRGHIAIPAAVPKIAAHLIEPIFQALGKPALLTRNRLAMLMADRRIIIDKARKDLHFSPKESDLTKLLGETFDHFRKSGQLKRH